MSRNICNVIVDKVISAVRVKVRNDEDSKTWDIDAATGCGSVAVKDFKPDGAHAMPAGDCKDRPVYGKAVESAPTDTSKVNASFAMTWSGNQLTKIRMTIGANSYDRTITWSGAQVSSVSSWSAV